MTQREQKWVEAFIDRYHWTVAKTMPWMPHTYVVRESMASASQHKRGSAVPDRTFEAMLRLIHRKGEPRTFGKKKPRTYRYLQVGHMKYWAAEDGVPMHEIGIINRAPWSP